MLASHCARKFVHYALRHASSRYYVYCTLQYQRLCACLAIPTVLETLQLLLLGRYSSCIFVESAIDDNCSTISVPLTLSNAWHSFLFSVSLY